MPFVSLGKGILSSVLLCVLCGKSFINQKKHALYRAFTSFLFVLIRAYSCNSWFLLF